MVSVTSIVDFICFDGDEPPKVEFTPEQQEKLNALLAKERKDAEEKAEKAARKEREDHQAAIQSALKNSQLTQAERDSLQDQLKTVQAQLVGKEEMLKQEKKELEERLTNEIKAEKARAAEFEAKYRNTVIDQALRDAAIVGDAFSTSQIVDLLRPKVKLDGDQVIVNLDDVKVEDDKRIPYVNPLKPHEAIERMKKLPELYGNLFKHNVAQGIGGSGKADTDKPLNYKSMSTEEYMRRRKEGKDKVGL